MADVQPLRGIRYDPARVDSISSVIAPPYDVISPKEQRFYHKRHPQNVIRLELGAEHPSDTAGDNKYTRAASALEEWLAKGILLRETEPAFYVVEHRFNHEGTARHRWGLTPRVRLGSEGPDGARPHESVMEERIVDRLKLLRACRVNLSPIMGIVDRGVGGGQEPRDRPGCRRAHRCVALPGAVGRGLAARAERGSRSDGESTWLEGAGLLAVYFIFALGFFLLP